MPMLRVLWTHVLPVGWQPTVGACLLERLSISIYQQSEPIAIICADRQPVVRSLWTFRIQVALVDVAER